MKSIDGQIKLPFQGAKNILLLTKGEARQNAYVGLAFGSSKLGFQPEMAY